MQNSNVIFEQPHVSGMSATHESHRAPSSEEMNQPDLLHRSTDVEMFKRFYDLRLEKRRPPSLAFQSIVEGSQLQLEPDAESDKTSTHASDKRTDHLPPLPENVLSKIGDILVRQQLNELSERQGLARLYDQCFACYKQAYRTRDPFAQLVASTSLAWASRQRGLYQQALDVLQAFRFPYSEDNKPSCVYEYAESIQYHVLQMRLCLESGNMSQAHEAAAALEDFLSIQTPWIDQEAYSLSQLNIWCTLAEVWVKLQEFDRVLSIVADVVNAERFHILMDFDPVMACRYVVVWATCALVLENQVYVQDAKTKLALVLRTLQRCLKEDSGERRSSDDKAPQKTHRPLSQRMQNLDSPLAKKRTAARDSSCYSKGTDRLQAIFLQSFPSEPMELASTRNSAYMELQFQLSCKPEAANTDHDSLHPHQYEHYRYCAACQETEGRPLFFRLRCQQNISWYTPERCLVKPLIAVCARLYGRCVKSLGTAAEAKSASEVVERLTKKTSSNPTLLLCGEEAVDLSIGTVMVWKQPCLEIWKNASTEVAIDNGETPSVLIKQVEETTSSLVWQKASVASLRSSSLQGDCRAVGPEVLHSTPLQHQHRLHVQPSGAPSAESENQGNQDQLNVSRDETQTLGRDPDSNLRTASLSNEQPGSLGTSKERVPPTAFHPVVLVSEPTQELPKQHELEEYHVMEQPAQAFPPRDNRELGNQQRNGRQATSRHLLVPSMLVMQKADELMAALAGQPRQQPVSDGMVDILNPAVHETKQSNQCEPHLASTNHHHQQHQQIHPILTQKDTS
eukprot:m.49353 g.49353  ORF g.49353 m.49353 type:complete len:794 (-) comp12470_c0_seq2:56-2437(-)